MKSILFAISFFIGSFLLVLLACSNRSGNNSSICSANANKALATIQGTETFATEGKTAAQDELIKIYSQSIAEYIKAVNKEYQIRFDTLFFGKHIYGQPDDFPDIELPATIENTQIRLISPEIGLKKQKERKSLFYINLIGWVDNDKAEFIFVTFSNGCEHQFDCFINYKYNAKTKIFELEKIGFENFLYKKE